MQAALGRIDVDVKRSKEAEELVGQDSSESNENFKKRFKREQRMVGIAKYNLLKAQEAVEQFDEAKQ
jgi:hypothetical protein